MPFDNASLQAMFTQFGPRISALVFDNKVPVLIGHKSSPVKTVDDLELVTIGNVDLVGVPLYPNNPAAKEDGMMFKIYHPTCFLQMVITSDEDHPDYLYDPMMLG